ncbi:hypothetical protein E2C01_035818 [Portunus trituberculatus]|uniref:Secreted protein n=1 Tax=Portunus trituberculatus TaxID=210409 RepID=A0A5B7F6Y9_PORTR|nr:hypothetical protein [Portunus trituberculatus]
MASQQVAVLSLLLVKVSHGAGRRGFSTLAFVHNARLLIMGRSYKAQQHEGWAGNAIQSQASPYR